jgi:hypothetical protein
MQVWIPLPGFRVFLVGLLIGEGNAADIVGGHRSKYGDWREVVCVSSGADTVLNTELV